MPAAVAAALARAAAAFDAAEAPDKTHDETVAELERAAGNAAQHGMPPGTRAAVDRMKGKWCRFVAEYGERLGFAKEHYFF